MPKRGNPHGIRSTLEYFTAVLICPGVCLFIETRIIDIFGRRVTLSDQKFAVLHCLITASGRVLNREEILDQVEQAAGRELGVRDRTVDVLICRLRKVLFPKKQKKAAYVLIVTAPGGYRLGEDQKIIAAIQQI